MLLRVLGPASGVCLALGPVFPEVAHRGPSLNWSWGGISPLGELLTFLCVWSWGERGIEKGRGRYVCVCV